MPLPVRQCLSLPGNSGISLEKKFKLRHYSLPIMLGFHFISCILETWKQKMSLLLAALARNPVGRVRLLVETAQGRRCKIGSAWSASRRCRFTKELARKTW